MCGCTYNLKKFLLKYYYYLEKKKFKTENYYEIIDIK